VTRAHPTVLTPHAGELARLLERDSAWVDAHRLEAASSCAERFDAVVVLKGAGTIVQAPTGGPVVCDTGPPSLATAGTGDVLTGVVAAFLAKGLDPVTAAAAAATAHGLAAAVSPHQAGLVASDVIAELPAALS
jgi:NAD(P)H-hydrate epimerase